MVFALLLLGAYLLGSVPSAYLIARWTRGIDIRHYGSGNVGAANISATVSRKWVVPVAVFDLGKGMLVVYLARLFGLEVYQQVLVGIAAIAGHNWSVFLRFSGGRGILTSVGALLVLAPWLTLILVIIALLFAPFRQLPLGALLVALAAPALSWWLSQQLRIDRSLWITLAYVAVLILVVVRRLTAPRTSLTTSVSRGELMFNRLVFDRDIRDRDAWVSRKPLAEEQPGSQHQEVVQ